LLEIALTPAILSMAFQALNSTLRLSLSFVKRPQRGSPYTLRQAQGEREIFKMRIAALTLKLNRYS
jgi:hypothetical protein